MVIFSIGLYAVPSAYAAHANEAVVDMAPGSGAPGCEETAEGCFLPTTVTIAAGGHVEWENTDNTMHVVASGNLTDDDAGSLFNSQMMMAGTTFSYTFEDAGEYPYFCMVHPWMVGTVSVMAEAEEHGHEEAHEETVEVEAHEETVEVVSLTAADIAISVDDGAKAGEKVAIDVTINGEHLSLIHI